MTVRIKICGITRLDDALCAQDLGVDAIGLNFWPQSPRAIPLKEAARIIDALSPMVTTVGVFVNQERAFIAKTVTALGLSAVQLHGDESPDDCRGHAVPIFKALHVRDAESLTAARDYHVAAFVLDAPSAKFGGSGERFSWELVRSCEIARPFLLAGGLDARNVAEAVRAAAPHGVDVASGVETSPGIKDHQEMSRFVLAARGAF